MQRRTEALVIETNNIRGEQSVADKFNDLIRAISDYEVGGLQVQFGCQLFLEVKGAAIRIQMNICQRFLECSHSPRRRSEWVFIRSQLDDVLRRQVELAGDFFDRAAWLIDRDVCECGVDGEGESHNEPSKRAG